MVAHRHHLAAVVADNAENLAADAAGGFDCLQYVGRVAAATHSDQQVAFVHQRVHLSGENVGVGQVVAIGSDQTNVVAKAHAAELFAR